MKKITLFVFIIFTVILGGIYFYSSKSIAAEDCAKCFGNSPCHACKTCNYCKHCAQEGGRCGICK